MPTRSEYERLQNAARRRLREGGEDAGAELLRLRAKIERSRRILREGGSDAEALRSLGLKRGPGRPRLSERERERIAGLYENMTTAPGPCRPQYFRNATHLDELFTAQVDFAEGGPGDLPADAFFVPDCDVPMSPEDALRNVGRYLGLTQRARLHDLLSELSRTLRPLDLPPRRGAKTT